MTKAKWIWAPNADTINTVAYFQKIVELGKPVERVVFHTSAHNHLKLELNGVKISGYVTPAPSNPEKSKFYLSYDVTDKINIGSNQILAKVLYFGGEGQNYVDGRPGFILEADIRYTDGTKEVLISDETWMASADTPYENQTPYQQSRRITPMESFDARKAKKELNWHPAIESDICSLDWNLVPQKIPEGGIHERIIPVPVGVQQPGIQVFDAGKIISGWPMLHLKGIEGTVVEVRYSEDLENERVKHNVANESSEHYLDRYIMCGDEEEHWAPDFTYKAFRYLEITGYPSMIQAEQIEVISAGTFVEQTGAFSCSNPLLNKIYAACMQTHKNNKLGQLVDCPHREQAQYLGDSDLQAESLSYNFYNSEVLKKVLYDFRDGQLENGRFPFVYPGNYEVPEFNIMIPEYDLHYVSLMEKIYQIYGETDYLPDCYISAAKMVRYYYSIRDKATGLMRKGCGFPIDWNISDWPYPELDETGDFFTAENCLLYRGLVILKKMALLLKKEQEAEEFDQEAEELKSYILKQLYDPSKKRYVDAKGSSHSHQGVNALALRCGLVPEEDKEKVLDFIESEGFASSTLLMMEVLRALFENGREKSAYELMCRTKQPSWGYMLEQGYKTIWEGFQNIESHCHAWNCYPARMMQEFILGIRPAAPGFSKVVIQPYIPEDMTFAEGHIKTVQGVIAVRWEKENGKLLLWISLPKHVEAEIECCGHIRTVESLTEQEEMTLEYKL